MVYADHLLGPKQKQILTRISLGLGFTPSNVELHCEQSTFIISSKCRFRYFYVRNATHE